MYIPKLQRNLQNTESLDISILVKITRITTNLAGVIDRTVVKPESGIDTRVVIIVREVEIGVLLEPPRGVIGKFPLSDMFIH